MSKSPTVPTMPNFPDPFPANNPPSVVVLSEALQELAVVAFRSDRTLTPADVVAATTWALALFVVAWEDDDGVADDGETATSKAALDGLRGSIEAARYANRTSAARRAASRRRTQ